MSRRVAGSPLDVVMLVYRVRDVRLTGTGILWLHGLMRRVTWYLRWLAALGLLASVVAGCDEPIEFRACVEPGTGHAPYPAQIVCTALPGSYRYDLPNRAVVVSPSNVMDVTVDSLEWRATVTWTDGEHTRVADVEARGTNGLPRILRPRVAGAPYQWWLEPRERTLIDFTYCPPGLSGPESGVRYDGDWRVTSIEVDCSLKSVCGKTFGDSIYCPPYEAGTYHASWNGRIIENACIVYPLFTSETLENELPYAPAPEVGYPYDAYRSHDVFRLMGQQNSILGLAAFPEQTATIRVVVEDEWGRRTSGSFKIPVRPLVYQTNYVPWGTRIRFYFADQDTRVYHVAYTRSATPYVLSTCSQGCTIRSENRVCFCQERDAVASGRIPCPLCFPTD